MNQVTEAQLAEPLERFASLHAQALRHGGADLLDMSYPNPRVHRDPRAFGILRELLTSTSQDALQYTPMGGGTVARRRVASMLRRRFDIPYGYRDVLLTPGATAAINVALTALFRPGDEVLVITPCWMDYFLYLKRLGITAIVVPSTPDKRLDLQALIKAAGPRTAGVILGQPSCPTGVLHQADELKELAGALEVIAARSGLPPLLISDEVHRDQVWGSPAFTSPAQFYPDTLTVYSFGKAWSLQGQRLGYLAVGPDLRGHDDALVRSERAIRSTGVCAPTALLQLLIPRIVDLEPDGASLREDQLALRRVLVDTGYAPVEADATAFVYAPCPRGATDWEFVTALARHGLLAMPSSLFHEPGFFRMALNVGSSQFREVARRLSVTHQEITGRPSEACISETR
ncbi:aminotransferase class I/II-fold pyridoxal phosphate-dependent enzyme [Streptomyces sp. NPDC056004]|uniref:aminotransferase class I/II-fold pyridoxal phosphate-dependent enzyme n=1 Tax=Streptomyces sp. NPDC056004 TaxID=3345677 RepID=UPI0035DB2DEB